MSVLFDYHTLAERLGVPADSLAKLEDRIRHQYGSDEMMFELRMLRTLEAVAQGATTLERGILEFTSDHVRKAIASVPDGDSADAAADVRAHRRQG